MQWNNSNFAVQFQAASRSMWKCECWSLAVEALAAAGHEVLGVSRGPADFHARVKHIACDITRPADVASLPAEFDWVVNTVSSTRGSVEEYRAVYFEGTKNLLRHLQFDKYVFTSSTSVYGQNDGSVVTETSAAEPASPTSRVLRETEELLLGGGRPVIVLRVAGIYGSGRGHVFQQFLRGEARIHGVGSRFLNMIHRDDVVSAIIKAFESGQPGGIYNVVDDEPVTEREFLGWLAKNLRRELPASVPESELSSRKRGATNKRVSNAKLRHELAFMLKYPNYREGYSDEVEQARHARH
jgi:nucleoside-diphosphate-sugar epimerase